MRTLPRYALAVPALAVLALAACGQKGPLVLPSKAPATKVPSTAAPAPAATAAKPGAQDGENDASPPKR